MDTKIAKSWKIVIGQSALCPDTTLIAAYLANEAKVWLISAHAY